MKVKFNRLERVAGLFVLATILTGLAMLLGVAIKQGWFEAKIKYRTVLKSADGIHVGTQVQIAGLRTGSVASVELRTGNEVHVSFDVSEKYADLVREDSVVRMVRPFVISEKILDVAIGSSDSKRAPEGALLVSESTADIMDLVSGRTLAPHLETLGKMMDNFRIVAEAILDPKRSRDIIHIFDQMQPLVKNMTLMSREVGELLHDGNKDKQMTKAMQQLAVTTQQVNKMLPEINKMVSEMSRVFPQLAESSPKLAADMGKIAENMAVLTDELQKTLPAVKATLVEVGPEIPRATRRAMEALDETVVTLKALQRSFLLRANASEVRAEEAERDRNRQPATAPVPGPVPASAPTLNNPMERP